VSLHETHKSEPENSEKAVLNTDGECQAISMTAMGRLRPERVESRHAVRLAVWAFPMPVEHEYEENNQQADGD
jgi:hypothetical protein